MIFLATLGVYFGLVLIGGATPQIYAQAATTRNFELKDEIEVQDELDKKPDDCYDLASDRVKSLLNLSIISNGIIEFVTDLGRLSKIGKYETGDIFDFDFEIKESRGRVQRVSHQLDSDNRWVQLAASDNVEGIISLLCPWAECSEHYVYDVDFKGDASLTTIKFNRSKDSLLIIIGIEKKSDEEAENFANLYNAAFLVGSCSEYSESKEKVVYQNTRATFKSKQVFIVTRLPRAGLNSLLAKDAK